MAEGNGSSNTAIVAIVGILILVGIFYFFFYAGTGDKVDRVEESTIERVVPERSGSGSDRNLDIDLDLNRGNRNSR
jgi:hypothetical protein